MTDLPCRQAVLTAAVLAAVVAVIAGGMFGRWALVVGAAVGGALVAGIACARQRSRR